MTANSESFVAYVLERLSPIRNLESGRFFGGTGISSNGVQFAMLMGNSLFFVVNDGTRSRYQQAGSECFSYSTGKKRISVHKYYEVPAEVLEDPESLLDWARESIRVANLLKKKKE